MYARVHTAHVIGIDGTAVDVEVDIAAVGLPAFHVVGLAEGAVRESRDRVKAALKNLGHNIFASPITINLAPADLRKEGSHFDVPMAVGLVKASGMLQDDLSTTMLFGELALDGELRPVSGVLPAAMAARDAGFIRIIVPEANAREAAMVPDIEVYGFARLESVIAFLRGEVEAEPEQLDPNLLFGQLKAFDVDLSDVKGQFAARRAAEIAAAGMHNLLFVGPPGGGKTMIARRMPTILPELSFDEALATTKIHSVAGLLAPDTPIVARRPFIAPHHTASAAAITGGTGRAMPGQVSIAHNGVLFLDEMLEFPRQVLDVLRQPMEDGEVTIARAGRTVTYPSGFMLVGATNPCPCGHAGSTKTPCTCTHAQIQKYRSRLSGPLMDRIDIHVDVSAMDVDDLGDAPAGESSAIVRERVQRAASIQQARFKGTNVTANARMTDGMLSECCPLSTECRDILARAARKFGLSNRAHTKIVKVARTIADLAGSESIQSPHIMEALQYRINPSS